MEPFGIYYNKTMFKRKGIPDPWEKRDKPRRVDAGGDGRRARRATNPAENEWGLDWATGFTDDRAVHLDAGRHPLRLRPQMTWHLEHPASVQAHTWMMDWVAKTRWNISGNPERAQMMEPWSGRALDNAGMTPFAYGKVAIHFRSVNDWSRMWPVVKDQFEWDMLPHAHHQREGGRLLYGRPPGRTCGTKTKHPDDVWEFLKFLIGDDFQGFMAQEQVLVPAKLNHQERFFRPPAQYPFQHAKVFADVFKKPLRHLVPPLQGGRERHGVHRVPQQDLQRRAGHWPAGWKEASTRMNQDIDWGGGEPPFKGLKLPIRKPK